MEAQMNESKPKRKYTRRYKRGKFADDKQSSDAPSSKPAGWDPHWNTEKDKKANEEHERRYKEWMRKRSAPEEASTAAEQMTRYFKVTKIMQEIDFIDLPAAVKEKERSELKVPILERSETIRL